MWRFGLLWAWLSAFFAGCAGAPPDDAPPVAVSESRQDKPEAAGPHAAMPRAITNSLGMKLVLIPPGEFLMGAVESQRDAREDEKPRRPVTISKPFYLGACEVTQRQFQQVTGSKRSFFSDSGPGKDKVEGFDSGQFPAEQVTWHEAVDFCRLLSELPAEKQAGRKYRLPTEAEWEYACRAGTTTVFHYGDSLSSTQANFNGNYPFGDGAKGPFLARSQPVGSYEPNAFGLYDMHGNVWEWCADWYDPGYYRAGPSVDPPGPGSGSSRVIRGGCWYSDARDCCSSYRNAEMPEGTFYVMGFRAVMSVGPSGDVAVGEVAANDAGRRTGPLSAATKGGRDLFAEQTDSANVGEDWPQWRGPRGDGTWRGPKLPERWPAEGPRRIWRRPVGGGYSGVAVAGGRAYTMDLQKDPEEFERVLCFHAGTGQPLWSHQYSVRYGDVQYGNGPRSTPAVFDGRVYTLGAVGNLYCLDAASGQVQWSADLVGPYRDKLPMWGLSASPLVYSDLLVVHSGVQPDSCLIAFDRLTGEEVWRSLSDGAGYCTPMLIESGGRTQLIIWTPSHVRGVTPDTGEPLWSIPFEVTYGTAIASPIFAESILFVSGYWEGSKAIQLGERPSAAEVLWEDRSNLRALMSQPLHRDRYAYLLDKRHGLTCFDFKSGKKIWDDNNHMTPKGRNPQATMVWIGEAGRAIILNSEGDLILARLNPSGYHEQSRARILAPIEGHPIWAHPAYAGNCVYARSDRELVAVSLLP